MASNRTINAPAPLSLSSSGSFDGDDGKWSTFAIGIGTPPQSFRILPSTTGAETWIPLTLGCDGIFANVSDCGSLRGASDFRGKRSRGFNTDASSTWDLIGTYELATEQNIWGSSGNEGLYGLDTISVDADLSRAGTKLDSQIVAGVVTPNVWQGSLGLGTSPANFSIENQNTLSLMSSLKQKGVIPSLSYGYTAGASYADVPGSLIMGGYDQARFTTNGIVLPVGGYKDQKLVISIASIVAEDTLVGIRSMLPQGRPLTTIIDSTVAQLWLPQDVCNAFEEAFGLIYDAASGLYLVNDTTHDHMKRLNPSVTLTIDGKDTSTSNTNIVLPYAAFDLQAGFPLFNATTNYFPLRVAANESQQVLGRAFLQEAYVFVDWERKNFTIGQAIHQNKTTNIVAVMPPTSDPETLSTGIIVRIAVGVCAIIALVLGLGVVCRLRKRKPDVTSQEEEPGIVAELADTPNQVHEMNDSDVKHELVCTPISELQGETPGRELDGNVACWDNRAKLKWSVYELP